MCGITGIIYRHLQRPVNPAVLKAQADAIAHRGPDAEGFYIVPGVGLAHRRLSIIDLEGGKQPLGNEDGSVQIVFNGEIYNYQRLRRNLELRGHQFQTHSDTEVIVHLYEEFGEDCLNHLRGMFAFCIWDSRKRRVFLARDRVGIKPLFVRLDGEKLLFGSELKAVLAHPGVPRDLDPTALDDFFHYGTVPGTSCIFKGIEKLGPGQFLMLDVDKWTTRRDTYWKLRFDVDQRLSIQDWEHAIFDKLRETVRLHMVSDVPVGSFLSGGMDSSVVTGLAFEATSVPLKTFSIGFQEGRFNELPYAREVAEHFGTEHVEQVISADTAWQLMDLAEYYDEPFADSSAIPTYLVSALASKHVKVVLSGDGGDEALGGYSRYQHDLKEAAIRECLPTAFRKTVLGALAAFWPKADWLPRPMRLKTLLTNLSLDADAAYANTLNLCRQPWRSRLMSRDLQQHLKQHSSSQIAREAYQRVGSDPLSGMIAADMATLLPDDYLVKVDRASMARGLEVRPPLLDHEFLELCARMPSELKIRNGETKWLLRQVSKRLLPDTILNRPKQGFEIPLDRWLRGPLEPLFEEFVLAPNAAIAPLIDQEQAAHLMAYHLRGIGRHGTTLWQLLSLGCWANRYLKLPQEIAEPTEQINTTTLEDEHSCPLSTDASSASFGIRSVAAKT